jgi:hypothetical protein
MPYRSSSSLMKGGDPDIPPPFKVVHFASHRVLGRGLTAKLALRLLGGVAVTKFQPMGQLAATSMLMSETRHRATPEASQKAAMKLCDGKSKTHLMKAMHR